MPARVLPVEQVAWQIESASYPEHEYSEFAGKTPVGVGQPENRQGCGQQIVTAETNTPKGDERAPAETAAAWSPTISTLASMLAPIITSREGSRSACKLLLDGASSLAGVWFSSQRILFGNWATLQLLIALLSMPRTINS